MNHASTSDLIPVHEADVVVWCGLACRKRRSSRVTQAGHCVASQSRAVGRCEFSQERSLCYGHWAVCTLEWIIEVLNV